MILNSPLTFFFNEFYMFHFGEWELIVLFFSCLTESHSLPTNLLVRLLLLYNVMVSIAVLFFSENFEEILMNDGCVFSSKLLLF